MGESYRIDNQGEFDSLIKAKPVGGYDIHLAGSFVDLRIRTFFENKVRIHAREANIKTAWLHCGNVDWIGGKVQARLGAGANGYDGYGFWVRWARNVSITDVEITDCNRGIAIDTCSNVVLTDLDVSVRQDGVIANKCDGLTIQHSLFHDFKMQPTDHSDAIQLRNGIRNCLISKNQIENVQQGIGQMDGINDDPLDGVTVIGNTVRIFGAHSITFGNTTRLVVGNNTVQQTTGRRTVLRLPEGCIQYGNRVIT